MNDGDHDDIDDDDYNAADDYNDDDDGRSTLEDLSRAQQMVHIRGFMAAPTRIIINPPIIKL